MSAKASYELGKKYPYDDCMEGKPDWAVWAARGVIADLTDRRGIKQGFEKVDDDIRDEIVQTLAEIIRIAATESGLTSRAVDAARRCPACKALLEEGSVYCDSCGTDTPRH